MSTDQGATSSTAAPATGVPVSSAAELRHGSPHPIIATPMKDRQVSTGTEKSGRMPHPHVSVSPPRGLGSRSPNSIPSSPTSVHSSSSAIFERDIEPSMISPTHPINHLHSTNPHRTPRSKTSEALDQSVPSVLDSAATLLAAQSPDEHEETQVDVVTTSASRATSVMGSPIGLGSRSPSPTWSAGNRTSMLLNLPPPMAIATSNSTGSPASGSPPRPTLQAYFSSPTGQAEHDAAAGPLPRELGSPTSAVSTHYESAVSSLTTTTVEHPPQPLPVPSSPAAASVTAGTGVPSSPQRQPQQLSHPPSPSHHANKRLSFISYNDLLSSLPVSTLPLSSFTSSASSEPPPHIPTVSLSLPPPAGGSTAGSGAVSLLEAEREREAFSGVTVNAGADVRESRRSILDDVGGEWEREGLGRGLEERLEALMAAPPVVPGKA